MLKHTILFFCCCLGFLAAPLMGQSQFNELNYNGVYQSERMGIVNDSHFYLKFYADGTVLRTYGDLTKESVQQIKTRLNKASAITMSNSVKSTTYRKFGNKLSFNFGSNGYTESYEMMIISYGLTGKYSSALIKRDERYTFLPDLMPPSQLFSTNNAGSNTSSNSNANSGTSTDRLSGLLSTSSTQPKIYAVLVGVADYKHINALRYTDDDAFRLYAFLKSPEGGALPDNQIEVLIDEAATKNKILEAMRRQFLKAGPNDVILFYFSGHGAPGSFVPVDFDGYSNLLDHQSIRNIFDQSRAKHKVVIADACHSGSLNKGVKSGFGGLDSYYTSLNNTTGGLALFMSSKAEETSLEVGGLRQSVFTYYLLEGLKGKADRNFNKVITIQELYTYVKNNVSSYTANSQSPVINGSYDPNMPLGIVR